jgi:hypothetical protein
MKERDGNPANQTTILSCRQRWGDARGLELPIIVRASAEPIKAYDCFCYRLNRWRLDCDPDWRSAIAAHLPVSVQGRPAICAAHVGRTLRARSPR